MPRFFIDPEAVSADRIIVEGGDYNHIRNVLRMHIGEELTVCDGQGTDYRCEVASYEDGECVLAIRERIPSTVELPVAITLYQGLPKKDKMELIVQKAVELGAVRIVPVMCTRTVVKLDDPKKEARRTERMQAIAEGAAKQSGRGMIPEVSAPMSFKEAIKEASEAGIVLVPYENALGMKETAEAFREAVGNGAISVFIGPEGGFERSEIDLAIAAGARVISLGRRILRTETAGLTVLSALMLLAEETAENKN
ncbi:MAG: 16S rRNA (uracil(1498)-N(3))-methyltransferase [Lachnospiraceae bacterium]|nr:16S rRNA (uracil(1498)-N(3))-methyltransferase [Lachnospiraceae bacterium]